MVVRPTFLSYRSLSKSLQGFDPMALFGLANIWIALPERLFDRLTDVIRHWQAVVKKWG